MKVIRHIFIGFRLMENMYVLEKEKVLSLMM